MNSYFQLRHARLVFLRGNGDNIAGDGAAGKSDRIHCRRFHWFLHARSIAPKMQGIMHRSCRFLIFRAATLLLLWLAGNGSAVFAADQPRPTLTFLSKQQLQQERTTDQSGASFTITGLSGITYRGGSQYTAVMDNSNKLVNLDVKLNADGNIAAASVTGGVSVATLRDYEGIAYTNAQRNSVFISNEATPPPPALF